MTTELTHIDVPTKPSDKKHPRETSHTENPWLPRLGLWLFIGVIFGALYLAWLERHYSPINAEYGIGYALGIIGGSLMLLLILYPARKRLNVMRNLGPVKHWYHTHMVLGTLGPFLVILHTNFQLDSLNSNVALFSMLLVFFSGVFEWFFLSKIKYGLHGQKVVLQEIKDENSQSRKQLNRYLTLAPPLKDSIKKLEKKALSESNGLIRSTFNMFGITLSTGWKRIIMRHQLKRGLRIAAKHHHWDRKKRRSLYLKGKQRLSDHLTVIRKAGQFCFYNDLSSLWHLLHLPLFMIMIVAGIVHVIAVHTY